MKRRGTKLKSLLLSLRKQKNHKLNLKDKIESNKNFYRMTKQNKLK